MQIEKGAATHGTLAKTKTPHNIAARFLAQFFLSVINIDIKYSEASQTGIKKFSFWTIRDPTAIVGIVAYNRAATRAVFLIIKSSC